MNQNLNHDTSELIIEEIADPVEVKDEKSLNGKDIYDIFQVFFQSVIIIAVLFIFVFRFSIVNGDSMNPTLHNKDWLILSSIGFQAQRGDIIVVSQPNSLNEVLIKRIIGLPGERIDITEDGFVTINDQKLEEPYTAELITDLGDIVLPHTVPQGMVFVMGDNRNRSSDSRIRDVGDIDLRYVVGEAKFRIFPFGEPMISKHIDYQLENGSTGEANE